MTDAVIKEKCRKCYLFKLLLSLFLYNMYGNKLVVKTYTYVKKKEIILP